MRWRHSPALEGILIIEYWVGAATTVGYAIAFETYTQCSGIKMNRVDNPELKRKVLDHLADLYKIGEVREPNHLSSYITCRTKAFLDQKQTSQPNDEEVMLFALGYGLQDVLTPSDAEAPIIRKDGVIYRPDFILSLRQNEIKTTRKSAKNHYIDEYLPPTWLDYMMGGCYMVGSNEYDLIVLYLMGSYSPPFPQLYCDTFYFDEDELAVNWQKILEHKDRLDWALEENVPPEPFQHCYEWECKYCRYKMVCSTIANAMGVDNKLVKDDQEAWQ